MGTAEGEPTVARAAATYLKHKYNKPGNVYIGVVSRLDSLVSGVLVLARTSKAASRLSEQIREKSTTKSYIALVEKPDARISRLPTQDTLAENHWITLKDNVKKNDARHRMEISPTATTHSQAAELRWRLLAKGSKCWALEIDLITGRKHQIRLQLSHAGLPILGDVKYGAQQHFPGGVALHCFRSTIVHPTKKETLTFEAQPPREWSRVDQQTVTTVCEQLDL